MGGRQSKVDSTSLNKVDGNKKTLFEDEEGYSMTYRVSDDNTDSVKGGEKDKKMSNKMYQRSKEEWVEQMNKTAAILKDLKDVVGSLEQKSQKEIIIKSNPCEKEECTVIKCYEIERTGDKLNCKAAVDAYYECSKKAYQ